MKADMKEDSGAMGVPLGSKAETRNQKSEETGTVTSPFSDF
jgi:hypothetical protein